MGCGLVATPLGSINKLYSKMIKQDKSNYLFEARLAVIFSQVILLAAFSVLFISCENEEEFPHYYDGNFIDSLNIVSQNDSINVMVEQLALISFIKDTIPFSEEIIPLSSDTINIILIVSFGSYSQIPRIIKKVNELSDTFYIWYSNRDKIYKSLLKNNSITSVATSPRIEYVSIDSIIICRSHSKYVNLSSRLIK
jgi:hypothetical protein